MMTEEVRLFFEMIRDFLSIFLPKQRGASKNTVKSYREALNLLLDFLCEKMKKPLTGLSFADTSKDNVLEYLDWLEAKRNNSVSSRNQRLFAIKSFFKYVAERDRTVMSLYIDISTIPKKKEVGEQHEIEFFSEASLKILLEQPDCKKKNGIRNLMFMILLYDTGARVQEILDIRLEDLHIDEHTPYVTVTGKGSKTRIVPLMMKTCEHLEKYIRRFHSETNPKNFLFYTERKGKREQMSVDNVEKFISKYAAKAHAIFPESPEHIYPHMWRHSRAMHLYRNGMPLELVAEWLGHSRTETTRRFYANADGTMKKEAIEKATSQINPLRSNELKLDWKSDEELLRKLYCLG